MVCSCLVTEASISSKAIKAAAPVSWALQFIMQKNVNSVNKKFFFYNNF